MNESIIENSKVFQGRTHWVFDLDNTLYCANSTVFPQVDQLMKQFIMEHLGVDRDEAHKIQKDNLKKHGLTMRGLMLDYGVDARQFLDRVHELDYSMIMPNQRLDQALSHLDGTKYIFTNSPLNHARIVLERIGIMHHFSGLFGIEEARLIPKPAPEAYDLCLAHFGLQPEQAIMIEDSSRNLLPASEKGMGTLWLDTGCEWGRIDHDMSYVDAHTQCLISWLNDYTGHKE